MIEFTIHSDMFDIQDFLILVYTNIIVTKNISLIKRIYIYTIYTYKLFVNVTRTAVLFCEMRGLGFG